MKPIVKNTRCKFTAKPGTAEKKKQIQAEKDRKARKKCRESRPEQKTCHNCTNPDLCSIEGTQDYINENSGEQ